MHIYLAGPLFLLSEFQAMESLSAQMRQIPGVTVTGPMDIFCNSTIAFLDSISPDAKQRIENAMEQASHVVVILRGVNIDTATLCGIDCAIKTKKHLWVLQTESGDAPFYFPSHPVELQCEKLFRHPDELLAAIPRQTNIH